MKRTLLTLAITSLLATTAFADPIHRAAAKGDLAGVQAELDKGADVNAKNDDGRTPLDSIYHIRGGKPETFTLLRKHGGKTGEELKAAAK